MTTQSLPGQELISTASSGACDALCLDSLKLYQDLHIDLHIVVISSPISLKTNTLEYEVSPTYTIKNSDIFNRFFMYVTTNMGGRVAIIISSKWRLKIERMERFGIRISLSGLILFQHQYSFVHSYFLFSLSCMDLRQCCKWCQVFLKWTQTTCSCKT